MGRCEREPTSCAYLDLIGRDLEYVHIVRHFDDIQKLQAIALQRSGKAIRPIELCRCVADADDDGGAVDVVMAVVGLAYNRDKHRDIQGVHQVHVER